MIFTKHRKKFGLKTAGGERKRTFAVTGLYHGAGVTMFCINFGCYLVKECKAKVALVECNESGDFGRLALNMREDISLEVQKTILSIGDMQFFSEHSFNSISPVENKRFDFVIYDIGTKFLKYRDIFDSCDRKVVIGSSTEWRVNGYEVFLSYVRPIGTYKSWDYVDMALGDKKAHFIDGGSIKLKRMAVIKNAFTISDDTAKWYRSLL